MILRPVLFVLTALSLLSCATGPKHPLKRDCRAQIDDCMDECPLDPNTQDSCFASCRNQSCTP